MVDGTKPNTLGAGVLGSSSRDLDTAVHTSFVLLLILLNCEFESRSFPKLLIDLSVSCRACESQFLGVRDIGWSTSQIHVDLHESLE